MSHVALINPVAPATEDSKHIIPVVQRLAGSLGVGLTEAQVREIAANPAAAFSDPRMAAVRHIAWRVCLIFNSDATAFRLDAGTLHEAAFRLDWQREDGFFCDTVWTQECRYLVPHVITEASDLPSLLTPLVNWKEFGFRFRHASALQVGLMLTMLGRLVMAAPATRNELDNLLLTLIYTPPWKLCENLYFYLKQNIDVEGPNEN